jgi:hypothetical protein
MRTADSTWLPLANGHHRIQALHPDHEAAIADFVSAKSIEPGIGATRMHLRQRCLNLYAAQDYDERRLERFGASKTFFKDMETRQGLTLRVPHKEVRAVLNEKYAAYFLERLNSLSND